MKITKIGARLLAVILVSVLMLAFATTAFAASYPYETTSMDDVNMRRNPNSSSTILKKIESGDAVTVLGATGSYYKLKFEETTGYAMKKYIDGTDNSPDTTPEPGLTMQAPPAVTSYPYDTTVISRVKLRKSAKADGEVYRILSTDAVVTVYSLSKKNGYAKVKHDGQTGYVLATNINLATFDTVVPTTQPTSAPVAGSENYKILKSGTESVEVSALQSALMELGFYTGSVDGKYGAVTEASVKTFQKRNGFTQTGTTTPEMQLLIYEGTPKDTKGYRQYVKTLAPIGGVTIKADSIGDAVKTLQTRLQVLGYYSGSITGKCDLDTINAMNDFELRHSLLGDSLMDAYDQSVLYGSTAISAYVVVTPTPAPTLAPPAGTVRRGDKGTDATLVQERLQQLGYYTGKITGTFNEGTEAALKAFQIKSGLEDDGICGPVTRTVLYGINAIYAIATPIPISTPAPTDAVLTAENAIIIKAGTLGEVVLKLQTRLQELGYYTSRLDGVYLTDDISAVREFQKLNSLTVDGKAGYQTQSTLYSVYAVGKTAEALTETIVRYGSVGDEVTALQSKLIELGYMSGEADGNFGILTKKALIAFQKANNLTRDGVAGSLTYEALNASSAIKNTTADAASTSLKFGAAGTAVKDMQSKLISLGYLKGKADGKFGAETSLALISFQKANGLKTDAIAGSNTLAKLTSLSSVTSVEPAPKPVTPGAPSISSSTISAANVRYANWYTEVKAKCRQYPNATVYDFTTGISWQVNMFSLGAHADSEPLTATDTANMNKAFGGKTTWTAKAVWVVFSDGTVYMGSTHNYPHAPSNIRNNNFDGHLCIHFPRTAAQVAKIGPYATKHQAEIDLGWAATLRRAGN